MTLFRRIAAALLSRSPAPFEGAQPLAPRVLAVGRAPDRYGHNTFYGSWLSQAVRAVATPTTPTTPAPRPPNADPCEGGGASPWVDPFGGLD